jgi:hypothetical protein
MTLAPEDVLLLKRLRVLARRQRDAVGNDVLCVFYGSHEIMFDEPQMVQFGERLIEQERFRAGDAVEWAGQSWDKVRELLEQLVDAGILRVLGRPDTDAPPPRPLSAAIDSAPPLAWRTPEELCRRLSDLVAAPVALELLEATAGGGTVVQSLRDDEGRQIGENSLAIRVPKLAESPPTEWRSCPFRGSRFEEDRPMNVSGLRQVSLHLEAVLAATTAMRRRLLARAGRSCLDIAHLKLLAELLGFVPAWLFLRRDGRLENGQIPAWVASLSKTITGPAITVEHMCFQSTEHGPDDQTSAAELAWVTETGSFFMSESGTCSGPPAMVDRTLRVFAGAENVDGGESLLESLGDSDHAFAVGLRASRIRALDKELSARTHALLEARLGAEAPDGVASHRTLVGVHAMRRAIAALDGDGERAAPPEPDWSHALTSLVALSEHSSEHGQLLERLLLDLLAIEWSGIAALDGAQEALGAMLGRAPRRLCRGDLARGRALHRRQLDGDLVAQRLGVEVEEDGKDYWLVSRRGRERLPGSARGTGP